MIPFVLTIPDAAHDGQNPVFIIQDALHSALRWLRAHDPKLGEEFTVHDAAGVVVGTAKLGVP